MIRAAAVAVIAVFVAAPVRAEPLHSPDETYAAILAGRYDDVEAYYARLLKERPRAEDGQFLLDRMIWASPVYSSDDPTALDYWPKTDALTAGWLARSPGSVLAAITRARALVRRAEHLDSVKADWKEIDKLVAEARRVMDASAAKGAKDPAWQAMRLRLARMEGLSHDELLDLVRAAAAVDPEPVLVWQEAAIALSSEDRKPENLVWLMNFAVERTRATEGTAMYLLVMKSAYWLYPRFVSSPFASGLDWKLLDESFAEVRKRYPNSYDFNLHAALACLAGDRPATAAAIRYIGTPNLPVWEKWGGKVHWERCKEWASRPPRASPPQDVSELHIP